MATDSPYNVEVGSLSVDSSQSELIANDTDVRELLGRVSFLAFQEDTRGVPSRSEYMIAEGRLGGATCELLFGAHRFANGETASTTHLVHVEPIPYPDGEEFVGIVEMEDLFEYGTRDVAETSYSLVPLDKDMNEIDTEESIEIEIVSPDRIRALERLIDADIRDNG